MYNVLPLKKGDSPDKQGIVEALYNNKCDLSRLEK